MKALSVESACGPVERVCGAKGQRTTSTPSTSGSGGTGEHRLEMGKSISTLDFRGTQVQSPRVRRWSCRRSAWSLDLLF